MISLQSLSKSWDDFFFKPVPIQGIGIFRILWTSILLLYFLFDIHNFDLFYGHQGLLSLQTSLGQYPKAHLNIFQIIGVGRETLTIFMGVYGIALLCSLFGFYTRASLTVVLVCMVSLHQRNIWLLSSSEVLMRIMTILLICSPCERSLSLDRLFAKKSGTALPETWAPWALRLMQIQLSVVYLWTVWHKLKGDNWIDGSAVYYATRLEAMTNFPIPYFLNSEFWLKLLTWGTLILEFALGSLIWIKEFRKPLIIAGIFFHLGIEYMMSIPFFEIIMMALLVNFFTPWELRSFAEQAAAFIRRLRARIQNPLEAKVS